jgi:flavin-binding protein dodecin
VCRKHEKIEKVTGSSVEEIEQRVDEAIDHAEEAGYRLGKKGREDLET